MKKLEISDVKSYVEENIIHFHERRLDCLKGLNLSDVLKRKNPYLFKSKNVLTSQDIIKSIVGARISSSEEGIFGNWLEGLAIFINNKVYDGKKSTTEGIDLEFYKDNIKYIVSIKSGPNWGNSAQIAKMRDTFKKAKKVLGTSYSQEQLIAVNGCCYGRDNNPNKGDYFKYCGQDFWEFISGNNQLYIEIIEPLGFKAKEKNDEYLKLYSAIINKLTKEFSDEYCMDDGSIDWVKLVKFNSSKKNLK